MRTRTVLFALTLAATVGIGAMPTATAVTFTEVTPMIIAPLEPGPNYGGDPTNCQWVGRYMVCP